jgi:hypothetical protein
LLRRAAKASAAVCPELAKADMRALGPPSGYDPNRTIWKDGVKALWYLVQFRFERQPRPAIVSGGRLTVISICIFALLLTIFAVSPIRIPTDSRWSLHTSLSFVKGNGGALTEFLPILEKEKFYAIEYPDGAPRTLYPIGTSLLVAPAVAVVAFLRPTWAIGLRSHIPVRTEQFLAAAIGAVAAVVFFWLIYYQFSSVMIALTSTAIFSLATSIWSTATRALWQHGPLILMLTVGMLLLARARDRPHSVQYVSLPLAMAYVIRPTAIVPVVVLTVYVLLCHHRSFLRYASWSLLIVVPWVIYNFAIYGRLLPIYYTVGAFSSEVRFFTGLMGNLLSPSRGLFVFSPVLIFALSGFMLALRDRVQRPLFVTYGAIIAGHCIIVGSALMWWAGHSFGPRFMTDIVPFLVFFLAFNFRLSNTIGVWAQTAISICILVLALISVTIHARGAFRYSTWAWNYIPQNIDENPRRAWDWRDPQFLR